MKFLILFFPLLGFSLPNPSCNPSCNLTPLIQKISFTPPSSENLNAVINISGESFPNCPEDTQVTMAQKPLTVISSTTNLITAEILKEDFIQGTYRINVNKIGCNNKNDTMDATIVPQSDSQGASEFTKRQTSPFSVFPYSYAEVEVACDPDEMAISGGFAFSTWEIKLVSSYPDGRFWRFKIYNNENITSMANEFYAICVR